MRLSELLSKPKNEKFIQVDGFLDNKILKAGKQKKLDIGNIALNYYCKNCGEIRTFSSTDKLYCIGLNNKEVSIDCVLECPCCKTQIPIWFLIESDKENIFSAAPNVKILKCEEKLAQKASLNIIENPFYELVELADRAHKYGLGSGSIIYLRIVLEQIVSNIADIENISNLDKNGYRKTFKDFFKDVDNKCHIVPRDFSEKRYNVFKELSECLHGRCEEKVALEKFIPLRILVVGIMENIKNKQKFASALEKLNWNTGGKNE